MVGQDLGDITVGLTQGSIVSPYLFNIFINDIVSFSRTRGFSVTLFADDAVFYRSGPDCEVLLGEFQRFIVELSDYLTSNKLSANVPKTKIMLFTHKKIENLPDIFFNGSPLEWVKTFKYLGTYCDRKTTQKGK